MPTELMQEFTGKLCRITMFNSEQALAVILKTEGNWLKAEENGKAKLINADLIRSIAEATEREQEAYRKRFGR